MSLIRNSTRLSRLSELAFGAAGRLHQGSTSTTALLQAASATRSSGSSISSIEAATVKHSMHGAPLTEQSIRSRIQTILDYFKSTVEQEQQGQRPDVHAMAPVNLSIVELRSWRRSHVQLADGRSLDCALIRHLVHQEQKQMLQRVRVSDESNERTRIQEAVKRLIRFLEPPALHFRSS